MTQKDPDKLTDQEEVFIAAYVANGYDRRAAMKATSYKVANPAVYAAKLLKRPRVVKAIRAEIESKRDDLWITEQDVIEKLYAIANNPKTPANARITALQSIGKHIGMFSERSMSAKELAAKGKAGMTVNITQYASSETQKEVQGRIINVVKEIDKDA